MNLPNAHALAGVALVQHMVRHLACHGVEVSSLLDGLHVSRDALSTPSGLMRLDEAFALLGRGAVALGDPWLGLTLGATSAIASHGVIGFLLAHHRTLGEGLQDVARALTLLLVDVHAQAATDADGALVFSVEGPRAHEGGEVFTHQAIASIVAVARAVTGTDLVPTRIELQDPRPTARTIQRWQTQLGVVPRFAAARDAVVFAAQDAALLVPGAEPLLLTHLHDAIEAQVTRRRDATDHAPKVIRLGSRLIDLGRGEVHDGPRVIPLTSKEQALLRYLADRPNTLVSKDELERSVWALGRHVVSHAPAVAMRRLRQKIEPDPTRPVHLLTVFGEGWKLVMAPTRG